MYGTVDQNREPPLRRQNTSEVAWGVSHAGIPFELDVSVTMEGMGQRLAETTEEESAPRILVPALKGKRKPIYSDRATAPDSVHVLLQVALSEKTVADSGLN